MDSRYALRCESGERRGETIGIPASGLTVGRKPGNTLQVLDNSVSGAHAVLEVSESGVLVRDLSSTNGTRVQNQRVLQQRLAHGDAVLFGNVRFTFLDARASAAPADGIELEGFDEVSPAESALAATTVSPGVEGLARVSAEHVAAAKQRSFGGLALVALLAALGAGLWYWFEKGPGAKRDASAAVSPVPGDLLGAGSSFEGDDDAWTNAEGTPAAFVRAGPARRTGSFGAGVDLAAGEWAEYRSRAVRAVTGQGLRARAALRGGGAAVARLGIRFESPSFEGVKEPPVAVAWSEPVRAGGGWVEVEVEARVPGGFSAARVVLLARTVGTEGGGEVAADDASLVLQVDAGRPAANAAGADLWLLGTSATCAVIARSERVYVSDLAFSAARDGALLDAVAATGRAEAGRFVLEPAAGAATLVLRAEEPLAHARVATIGKDGYRTHALDFERSDVTALLFGSGADMVRIQLAGPAAVRGLSESGASRVVVTPASAVVVQLDFAVESKEAGNVAHAARSAEQRGELGAAIREWQALLNGYPVEQSLVDEAEAARTRLVQKGLEELRVMQGEVERARFFRLPDLLRQSRDEAEALARRYEKSEIEEQARKLVALVTSEVGALEVDRNRVERARVQGILATLEAQGSKTLAGEVRRYLTEALGGKE